MNRNSTTIGVTPISLLFFRFTLAAVIMIGIARMRGEAMPRGRSADSRRGVDAVPESAEPPYQLLRVQIKYREWNRRKDLRFL